MEKATLEIVLKCNLIGEFMHTDLKGKNGDKYCWV